MAIELDYCEYANDAAAQAAYVSSDTYGTDVLSGGTPSASSTYSTFVAANACDNNETTYWESGSTLPAWWKYDFGAGVTKTIQKIRYKSKSGEAPIALKMQGSNNDSDWTDLYSGNGADTDNWQDFTFSNSTAYRYYRIYMTTSYHGAGYVQFKEVEMMELHLQCYSENTIKQQGSYSLKGIAVATDSLNDTLTRTI